MHALGIVRTRDVTHDRAGIKRNVGRAPPVCRLFNLLFKQGQTPAKNRTPLPLPYLLLHHFVHSYNGLRRVVILNPSLVLASGVASCLNFS